jgi:hypothetical protein
VDLEFQVTLPIIHILLIHVVTIGQRKLWNIQAVSMAILLIPKDAFRVGAITIVACSAAPAAYIPCLLELTTVGLLWSQLLLA